MEVHKQYCNDPLSGLSKSSSETIIMIPEKVHKTYYKIMFKQYTTIIQKKDLNYKPASTGWLYENIVGLVHQLSLDQRSNRYTQS